MATWAEWIIRGRAAAKWAGARSIGFGLGAAALLFLAGECSAWRRESLELRRPVVVKRSPRFESPERVVVPADLEVPALQARTLERVRRDYGADVATVDRAGVVVGPGGRAIPGGIAGASLALEEVELPRLPDGGSALVIREPAGGLEVRVLPKPRPFFELRREWSLGVLASPLGDGKARVYVRWSGLRVGRVSGVLEGGQAWSSTAGSSSSGAYLFAGAELRFGER